MKKRAFLNHTLRVLLSFVFLLAVTNLVAQTGSENPYPQLLFPNFQGGNILMKSGTINEAFLNYNMVDEEMLMDRGGEYRVLSKPEEVDTIFIGDEKFVWIEKLFYEVVSVGKVSIFIQHKSRYVSVGTPTAYGMTSQTNASAPVATIQGGNQVRHLERPDNVKVTCIDIYWARIGTEMHRFSNFKQYAKLFGDQEDKVKDFVKSGSLEIKSPDDLKKLGDFSGALLK